MDTSINEMRQDLARAAYAETTQKQYVKVAESVGGKFGKPVATLTRDEVRAFTDEVMARPVAASTKIIVLAAMRYLYAKTLGRPAMVSFIRYPKRKSVTRVVLSLGEIHRLIQALRDPIYQAIAMVLYGAGLRLSEAMSLKVDDIDGERGVIYVRKGKGGKAREAKLSPTLHAWLRAYWDLQRPALPYLFATRRTGKPPIKSSVGAALKKASAEAHIKKSVTPHVLRHSFATHLLEQGTDVAVVAHLLGHESLATVMRYARVTQKLVRETPSPLDLLPHRRQR